MIQVALTPEQFAAKAAQLEQQEGVVLQGNSGKISKRGVTATWSYDGAHLTVTVIDKPWLVTEAYCEQQLTQWLNESGT